MRWIILLSVLFLVSCAAAETTAPEAPVIPVGIIDFWEPVTAALSPESPINEWQFLGQAGDPIMLRTVNQGISVALTLLDANGSALAEGERVDTTLPASGIYTVRVRLSGEVAGGYELGLGYSDRPNPAFITATPLPQVVGIPTPTPLYGSLGTFIGTIDSGETLGGTFIEAEEQHIYTFNGDEGEFVFIQMGRVSGGVDPVLSIYDPAGSEMATDDNMGGNQSALLRNIRLPQSGLYSIRADGDGFSGGYQISLLRTSRPAPITPTVLAPVTVTPTPEILTPVLATAIPGNRLEDHVPVIGSILQPGDFSRHPIFAASGELIIVGVSPTEGSELRPKIEIYDPVGELVSTATVADSSSDGDAVALLQAEGTGAYLVYVSAEDGTIGPYVISYGTGATREDVRFGLTEPDRTYAGTITRRGLRDVYSVLLNQDDIISAVVSPGSPTLNPALELVAPDGSLVAVNGSTGGDVTIDFVRIPLPGVYYLRVYSTDAVSTGDYALIWRYINLAPTSTPPPAIIPVMSYTDEIVDRQYEFYPFQGRAGQRIRIAVLADPGSGFDPVAALLGPDGQIIAEGDDSRDDLNPRFNAELTADGTYTVRVTGYESGGSFRLLVDEMVN